MVKLMSEWLKMMKEKKEEKQRKALNEQVTSVINAKNSFIQDDFNVTVRNGVITYRKKKSN